ncbi:hypothetical protein P170DRAFT_469201 [Aspergillus steynii IBT 23096]|uniref:Rhodopsin domain-containing protein n=1 Tax=Aspergillus steynii IBT 23096 TaxID=1392250 RepID=A0A2I2GLG4_9EURO|nr:uncharacterized protein P170DRAFT_469201 [Aspergillus steynii IBT 23096]PLB53707.1 hypothetical protein P170DRAFT_469201 [Aspergillus steynii IBT 23096]
MEPIDVRPQTKMSAPEISETTFLAVLWISVGTSFLFLATRLVARWKIAPQKRADDAFLLLAWLFFLGNVGLWTAFYRYLFIILQFSKGNLLSIPLTIDWHQIQRDLRAQLAGYFLTYCSLWSAKFSFLFFFRKLGERYRLQKIIWWSVCGLLILTFAGCIGTLNFRCELSEIDQMIQNCASAESIRLGRVTVKVSTSLDIVTDVAIILLSSNVLWRARINWKRKLALIGISLLTAFIICVSIIRMVWGNAGSGIPDASWLIIWSGVEICVAIMVACLASFWTLYTMAKARSPSPTVDRRIWL